MYKSFFGLKESPFKITPDLDFFFRQSSRDFSLQSLKYAVDHNEGVIKVVGEVGAGKTTLLRLLLKSLPTKFFPITLPSPTLSPKEVLLFIAESLSLECTADQQKHELVELIDSALISEFLFDKQILLLVDESQSCSLDTLEEIRLLSNLETEKRKLIQIILFGQTELDITLKSLEAKPLKARISSAIYLNAFNDLEVQQYLNYRMRVAGYAGEDVFTLPVAKEIARLTQGLPRAINILADKLLLRAFSESSRILSIKMFKQLPGYEISKTKSKIFPLVYFVVSFVLIFIIGFYAYGLLFGVDNNKLDKEPINLENTVLETFVEETSSVYKKLPKYFYTTVLFNGTHNDVNLELIKLTEVMSYEQQQKLFVYCATVSCVVMYGYSNNREIVAAALKQLPLKTDRTFNTIKISAVDALIQ